MRCKNCGFENNEGLYICQNCGSPLYDEDMSKIAPEQEYEQKIAQIDTSDEDKEAAKKKRNIIITCVAAVLVVAIATAVIVFAVKGSGKEPTEPQTISQISSETETTKDKGYEYSKPKKTTTTKKGTTTTKFP